MSSREILEDIVKDFKADKFSQFFRLKNNAFVPKKGLLLQYDDEKFTHCTKIGEINFDKETEKLLVVTALAGNDLSERSSKKAQYDKAKKLLKEEHIFDAGIFIFYDQSGNFRFSLIYEQHLGTKRRFNNFRRSTYFVNKQFTNKTFFKQIGEGDFSSLEKIKDQFSVAAVTNEFYNNFYPLFDKLSHQVFDTTTHKNQNNTDFALLLVIRIIFIGFIQKRKWIGNTEKFLQNFYKEYKSGDFKENSFYKRWLEPLFFEALNSPMGAKVAYGNNDFSEATESALQMAPYLNGGLYQRKEIDNQGLAIEDSAIEVFFDFLFAYNFTIEENTPDDEDLELNPEFLGIIFERLVNKADGAIYTPRTEVDFMCRMTLVKWLERNLKTSVQPRDLYELFFREKGNENEFQVDQKTGSFSERQVKEILALLETITICDPAVGSGAFPVGMMHVLDEVEQVLRDKVKDSEYQLSDFERKKRIINSSLYGVEVKPWAVWITQLRLWISLFIDAPEELKLSLEPILPSLDFKIRCGDSLVQRVGNKIFPIAGHAELPKAIKDKVTGLKNLKADYFHNKNKSSWEIQHRETSLFREIIDAQIWEREERIRSLKGLKPQEQAVLFGELDKAQQQQELKLQKENLDILEQEVLALKDQKQSLKEDHPLIWNIEFAEIFTEKGGFDIIIGNPPYVRQENIADPNGKIRDPKKYRAFLEDMVRLDFPKQFSKRENIDGKSDLYIYFYFRSLRLLNTKGVLTFICSNSWLDAGYGSWLQKFLLTSAPVLYIFDNHAQRSFAAADVNTIISIICAPQKAVDKNHFIKFVAFKKPFEDVVFTENLLEIDQATDITKNDKFRIYPITNDKLRESGNKHEKTGQNTLDKVTSSTYVGDKWGGKFLRAPDIFFVILEKGKTLKANFSDYFDGERYLNTGGADGFFVVTDIVDKGKTVFKINNVNHLNIEENFSGYIEKSFLSPLIKDWTKQNKQINIQGYDAFCFVPEDIQESDKAYAYIKWGERQGYNKQSVTKLQKPWYKPTNQMAVGAPILIPRTFNDTFVIYNNPKKFLSLRFYRISTKNNIDTEVASAYLNSTYFALIIETLGMSGLGQGALNFVMADFLRLDIPFIKTEKLITPFKKLATREIQNIFMECGLNPKSPMAISEQDPKPLSDRAALDKIIFDEIGLTENERKDVYRAVCQLVWDRISKAQSV
jgi:hypothetical protein